MKKTVKILSFTLAVIIMFAVIPFSSVAAESAKATWKDGDLLLSRSGLFGNTDTDSVYEGIKVTEESNRYVAQDPEKSSIDVKENKTIYAVTGITKNHKSVCGGISTDLPLTGTEKYTIKMTATFASCNEMFVGFAGNTGDNGFVDATTVQGIRMQANLAGSIYDITSTGHNGAYTASSDAPRIEVNKDKAAHHYVFEIDGYKVNMYIDGQWHRSFDFSSSTKTACPANWQSDLKLVISTAYSAAAATAGADIITVENVEIYAGNIGPKVYGMQYTEATSNNTQSIRFLATVDTLDADLAGFAVTAKYKDSEGVLQTKNFKVTSKNVYTSITATENGTVKPMQVSDMGGKYIVAISIDDVPTNIGQIDFTVNVFLEGSVCETINSRTGSFSMKDAVAYTGTALK